MEKRALITGITGQDGSYLAEFLLQKDYKVFGFERRASERRRENLKYIEHDIIFISGDLLDQGSLLRAFEISEPHEVYNLASQSFVQESWKQPAYTAQSTGVGVINILEAVRIFNKETRFYQASSSEMFGRVAEIPQTENTPFYPRSPYGIAKLLGHWMTVNYRESYNIFACSGILFNHESPRRGLEFVTRKITNAAAKIKLGFQNKLELGTLAAKRDWGFAGDFVEAMWLMLQQDSPDDYVIATGESHSVQEFIEQSFNYVGLDWNNYVVSGAKEHIRPAEVYLLVGDYSKALKKLGWKPRVKFQELVRIMVEADIKKLSVKYN